MRFVFTKLFYALLALGFVPLSLSWGRPWLRWATVAFDLGLLLVALLDSRLSRLRGGLEVRREFGGRFHIGAETEVRVHVLNRTGRRLRLRLKDEYPPELTLVSPREAGLSVVGVQAPRFPFAAEPEHVAAGLARLGVEFPVAIDAEHDLWAAYGCEGWPSLFLWSLGGALSWAHFGEGEYRETEEAIQAELREIDALRDLPEPLAPLRPSDAPGVHVIPPTPEVFPGGTWERPWIAGEDGEDLALDYQAGGAYATVEGDGELQVEIDGEWRSLPADPIPGLRTLAEHPRHEAHSLVIRPAPGVKIWSISFAAGVP